MMSASPCTQPFTHLGVEWSVRDRFVLWFCLAFCSFRPSFASLC